jgi:hypothetical protein
MLFRALAALAAASVLIFPGAPAGASGTLVLAKIGEKPQSFTGARLVLKPTKLMVILPDKRELDFDQSSCQNSVAIAECQPIDVNVRDKSGTHDLNVTGGLGYFNLTKVPQTIPTKPPQKLPRAGLYLTLQTDDGTSITVRGTLDSGAANLTGN